MNFTAIIITALICATIGFVFWLAYEDEDKDKEGKR